MCYTPIFLIHLHIFPFSEITQVCQYLQIVFIPSDVVEEQDLKRGLFFEFASPPLHLHKLYIIGKLRCCRSMFEGVWSSTEVPLPWKQRLKIHIC